MNINFKEIAIIILTLVVIYLFLTIRFGIPISY